MATNVLIELINSIFGNVMAGVTTLLAGSTGQVIVGFTSIALLLALIVYVRKTFSGSKA
jgi:glucose uptake protein GlcU